MIDFADTHQTTLHTLPNGLTIILREVHSAPVISWWVAYRIGSRNERTGQTGISHWLEHMMFKGTPKYEQGELDRLIDRSGGQWNAFTSMDHTMYYETLPSDQIDLALDAEADRMFNALFDPEEVESERTVVISERRDNENSPTFWLNEELRAAAFRVHGYHHSIIGDMTDLYSMTREDVMAHYANYYRPSNAVAIAVGDFDTATMLAKIEKYYGGLPTGPAPTPFMRPEPEQLGERRVVVERPGHTAFVRIAHRAPSATEKDWFSLAMLDSILSGPGGNIDNKTSRLYRRLVVPGIAAGISGSVEETIDPYLYQIGATVSEGRTPAETEANILEEIERVQQDGIAVQELEKAKKQARASFAYETERVTNQAYWLAQSAMLNDVDWFDTYLSCIDSVTPEDVQQVAQSYLNARSRIVGWLLPTGMEGEA